MAMKIKKGDNVIVIAGKNKDKEGKVLEVNAKEGTVLIEGVNKVKTHAKPNQANPNGGIVDRSVSVHVSNVVAYREPAEEKKTE